MTYNETNIEAEILSTMKNNLTRSRGQMAVQRSFKKSNPDYRNTPLPLSVSRRTSYNMKAPNQC